MSSVRIALVALAPILAAALCAGTAYAGSGQDVLHEVRAGDNLHLIAGYYYGDARQWERIWQANREQVSNQNRIGRGTWLRIPDADVPAESYSDFLGRMGPFVGKETGGPHTQPTTPMPLVPAAPSTPASTQAAPAVPAAATAVPPSPGPPRQ